MALTGLTEFDLWSKGGWPRIDIAGESYHQDEIRSLLPTSVPDQGVEVDVRAHLLPEPSNSHDPNAVRVEVRGLLIGYIPKDLAPGYGPVLSALVARGLAPTTPCRIWAYERQDWKGKDRYGRDVYESVLSSQASIVLDAPHRITPLNTEPTGPHRTLPHGGALQVRGEEKHLDVLAPWVAKDSEGWIYAGLRVIELVGRGRSKEIVEITLDGEVIGELTPAMSAHYIPGIRHSESAGDSVVAKVLLKGNAMKVEAVLYAARAHELDAEWMNGASEPTQPSNGRVGEHAGPPSALTPATGSAVVGEHFVLPPRPDRIVFNPAPGWPPAPPGWTPPAGWKPMPDWPTPPEGWEFWKLVHST